MKFITNENGVELNTLRELPQERYIAALERIKSQIEAGNELQFDDSNEWGNKYTECSWGLCSRNHEQWPDKEDRLFPRDNPLSILYRGKGQDCPMDQNQERDFGPSGCFYHCRIFQNTKKLPTREEAIQLYQIQLDKVNNANVPRVP